MALELGGQLRKLVGRRGRGPCLGGRTEPNFPRLLAGIGVQVAPVASQNPGSKLEIRSAGVRSQEDHERDVARRALQYRASPVSVIRMHHALRADPLLDRVRVAR